MSTTVIADAELETDEPTGKRGRLKLTLLLVMVVLGAAGAAWFFLLPGEPTNEPPEDGEIVALEPMTTTVGEASMHHARVAVAVVLAEGQDATVIEARKALLQDALLQELARMDGPQVRSADGSDELRVALTDKAREIWGEDVVRRVVLTELLIN